MKELFTTNDTGFFWVDEEGLVYSIFDHTTKKRTFFDVKGNVLENYAHPPIQDEEATINDPDFFADIGDGFYTYTTHEVVYDVDGKYGLFGIKYHAQGDRSCYGTA